MCFEKSWRMDAGVQQRAKATKKDLRRPRYFCKDGAMKLASAVCVDDDVSLCVVTIKSAHTPTTATGINKLRLSGVKEGMAPGGVGPWRCSM